MSKIDRTKRTCPLCGRSYIGAPAISRDDNATPICPECGTRQALAGIGVGAEEQEEILRIIRRATATATPDEGEVEPTAGEDQRP